jgi:hypothetical protein
VTACGPDRRPAGDTQPGGTACLALPGAFTLYMNGTHIRSVNAPRSPAQLGGRGAFRCLLTGRLATYRARHAVYTAQIRKFLHPVLSVPWSGWPCSLRPAPPRQGKPLRGALRATLTRGPLARD